MATDEQLQAAADIMDVTQGGTPPRTLMTEDQERIAAEWAGALERRKTPRGTDEEYRRYVANKLRLIDDKLSKPWWKRLIGR